MSLVSYAQNFEDVLLHRVFGGQEIGFYVDVGAYHPADGSVTKLFYDRGWSGINVEPGTVFDQLALARPRDVNLRMAVLDRTGEVAFVDEAGDGGTSHVAEETGPEAPGPTTTRSVPCDTLENIVRAHARGRPVDFLKVDAEGSEAAIVRSTDWRRLRPRVLVFEATLPWSSTLANAAWEPALLEQGYARTYFDGINCFYVPEEDLPVLHRHFQTPVNVLDQATRHDPAAAATAAERDRCGAELAAARTALDALHREHEALAGRHEAAAAAAATEVASLKRERDRLGAEQAARQQHVEALQKALDTLRTESEMRSHRAEEMRAELQALRADGAALSHRNGAVEAELERLRDEARASGRQVAAMAAERDGLTAERDGLLAERDAAIGSADALASAHEALERRHVALVAERDELGRTARDLEARLVPEMPPEASPPPLPSPPPRRSLGRAAASGVYSVFRPLVRPVVWRLRGFLTSELAQQMRRVEDGVRRVGEHQRELRRPLLHVQDQAGYIRGQVEHIRGQFQPLLHVQDQVGYIRGQVEHIRGQFQPLLHVQDQVGYVRGQVEFVRGQVEQVRHHTADDLPAAIAAAQRALSGTLAAQDARDAAGAVELRRLATEMEHALLTLALDAAAPQIEAREIEAPEAGASGTGDRESGHDPVADPGPPSLPRLSSSSGQIPPRLAEGHAIEVACPPGNPSVLTASEGGAWHPHVRRYLDAAARPDWVCMDVGADLGAHAPSLDEWAARNGLPRLDFVRLDVEGSELRVLRGAEGMLRRHRPVLLVRYDPARAARSGQPTDALFRELEARFAALRALEEDGSLTPTLNWDALRARLDHGRGWEDLVCLPDPEEAAARPA